MSDDRWNSEIHLYPADRWFGWLAKRFPASIKPNHLTVLRMALVPVVAWYLHLADYTVALPLFMFAAATDWLDGLLARTRREITEWGIVWDPIADKLLVGMALFMIVFEHVNVFIGSVLLAIEVAALIASYIRHRRGIVKQSNSWGKAKMVFEVAGITLLLGALWSGRDLFVNLSTGTLALALVAALASVFWRIR